MKRLLLISHICFALVRGLGTEHMDIPMLDCLKNVRIGVLILFVSIGSYRYNND
jgi:hypothetical protein